MIHLNVLQNVYKVSPRSVKNQFCFLDFSLPKDTGYVEDQGNLGLVCMHSL